MLGRVGSLEALEKFWLWGSFLIRTGQGGFCSHSKGLSPSRIPERRTGNPYAVAARESTNPHECEEDSQNYEEIQVILPDTESKSLPADDESHENKQYCGQSAGA